MNFCIFYTFIKIIFNDYYIFTKINYCLYYTFLKNITSDLIVVPDQLFKEFNGASIENFVAQELLFYGQEKQFYWTSRGEAEVDFIIESNKKIYPVEVKSGTNRNLKSLRSYADKYHPEEIFRLSPWNLIPSTDFVNIPLYAVNVLIKKFNPWIAVIRTG